MGDDFCVRLGDELVPLFDELMFQLEIIFNNSVVDDDDFAGAIAVGMRVFFRGTAVRGPTRVPNAINAVRAA